MNPNTTNPEIQPSQSLIDDEKKEYSPKITLEDITLWENDPRIEKLTQQGVLRSKYPSDDWHQCAVPSRYMLSRKNTGLDQWQIEHTAQYYITFRPKNFRQGSHLVNPIGNTPYFSTEGPKEKENVFGFYQALVFDQAPTEAKLAAIIRLGYPGPSSSHCFFDYTCPDDYLSRRTDEKIGVVQKNKATHPTYFPKTNISISKGSDSQDLPVFTIPIPDVTSFTVILQDRKAKENEYLILAEHLYEAYKLSESGPIGIHCAAGVGRGPSLIFTFLLADYWDDIIRSKDPLKAILTIYAYECSYRGCTQLTPEQFFQSIKNASVLREYEATLGKNYPQKVKNRDKQSSFADLATQIEPVAYRVMVEGCAIEEAIQADEEKNIVIYCRQYTQKLQQQAEVKSDQLAEPGKKEIQAFLQSIIKVTQSVNQVVTQPTADEPLKKEDIAYLQMVHQTLLSMEPLLQSTITANGSENKNLSVDWSNSPSNPIINGQLPSQLYEKYYREHCLNISEKANQFKQNNPELSRSFLDFVHCFQTLFFSIIILRNKTCSDPQAFYQRAQQEKEPYFQSLFKALSCLITRIHDYSHQSSLSPEKLDPLANLIRISQDLIGDINIDSQYRSKTDTVQKYLAPTLKTIHDLDSDFLRLVEPKADRDFLVNLMREAGLIAENPFLAVEKEEEKSSPLAPQSLPSLPVRNEEKVEEKKEGNEEEDEEEEDEDEEEEKEEEENKSTKTDKSIVISLWKDDPRIVALCRQGVLEAVNEGIPIESTEWQQGPVAECYSWVEHEWSIDDPKVKSHYVTAVVESGRVSSTQQTRTGYTNFEDPYALDDTRHHFNKIGSSPYIVTEGPHYYVEEESQVVDFYYSLLNAPFDEKEKVVAIVGLGTPGIPSNKGEYLDYLSLNRYRSKASSYSKTSPDVNERDFKEKTAEIKNRQKISDTPYFCETQASVLTEPYKKLTDQKALEAHDLTLFNLRVEDAKGYNIVVDEKISPSPSGPIQILAKQVYRIYKLSETGSIAIHDSAGVRRAPQLALTFLILDYYQEVFTAKDPLQQILKLYAYVCSYQGCTRLSRQQFIQAIQNAMALHAFETQLSQQNKHNLIKNRSGQLSFSKLEQAIDPIAFQVIVNGKPVKQACQEDRNNNLPGYCKNLAADLQKRIKINSNTLTDPGKEEKQAFLAATQQFSTNIINLIETKTETKEKATVLTAQNLSDLHTLLLTMRGIVDSAITPSGTERHHLKQLATHPYPLADHNTKSCSRQKLVEKGQLLKSQNLDITSHINECTDAFERMLFSVIIGGNRLFSISLPDTETTPLNGIKHLVDAVNDYITDKSENKTNFKPISTEKLQALAHLVKATEKFYKTQGWGNYSETSVSQQNFILYFNQMLKLEPTLLDSLNNCEQAAVKSLTIPLTEEEEKNKRKVLSDQWVQTAPTPHNQNLQLTESSSLDSKHSPNSKTPIGITHVSYFMTTSEILARVLLSWATECGLSALPLGISGLSGLELDEIRLLGGLFAYGLCMTWQSYHAPIRQTQESEKWVRMAILLGIVIDATHLGLTIGCQMTRTDMSPAYVLGLTMGVGAAVLAVLVFYECCSHKNNKIFSYQQFKNGLQSCLLLILPLLGSYGVNKLLQNFASAHLDILNTVPWGDSIGLSIGATLGVCLWAAIYSPSFSTNTNSSQRDFQPQ